METVVEGWEPPPEDKDPPNAGHVPNAAGYVCNFVHSCQLACV